MSSGWEFPMVQLMKSKVLPIHKQACAGVVSDFGEMRRSRCMSALVSVWVASAQSEADVARTRISS